MLRIVVLFVGLQAFVTAGAFAQSPDGRFVFPTASVVGAAAQPVDVVRALVDDAADGRLDRHDLFDAVLIAGETFDARLRRSYRDQLEQLIAELKTSGRVVGGDYERARAVHEFLHSRSLRSFHEACTTLDQIFAGGRFNCISSSILFRLVGERFGLRITGVEVPGHAYVVVETTDGPLVVQTTCADWFVVLADPAGRRAVLERTLGRAAAAADGGARDGRRLSDVGLAAIVAYNRGLDHLEAKQFDAAIAANRTALELDARNSAARANLLATINNWSLARFHHGDFDEALRLLEEGVAVAPDYQLFYENLIAVHQQALARRTATDAVAHRRALADCYRRWEAAAARRGSASEAARIAGQAAGDPFLRERAARID